MSALLADLGGTYLRCGLAEGARGVRVVRRARIRNAAGGCCDTEIWEDIVGKIAEFAAEARKTVPATAPVVVSFPGPVSSGGGILDAPTVAGWSSAAPDLHSILRERTGRDVHILNDVSAAAWQISETITADRFMVVTVSSGIGSKIFDRRHAKGVLDDVTYAGEIGHLTVIDSLNAPRCDCGASAISAPSLPGGGLKGKRALPPEAIRRLGDRLAQSASAAARRRSLMRTTSFPRPGSRIPGFFA